MRDAGGTSGDDLCAKARGRRRRRGVSRNLAAARRCACYVFRAVLKTSEAAPSPSRAPGAIASGRHHDDVAIRLAWAAVLVLAAALLVAPWFGHFDDTDAQLYQVVVRKMAQRRSW